MGTSGGDFVNGAFEIRPGLIIDDRLRVGGMIWLEEKFGKPIDKIDFTVGRNLKDTLIILTALLIQRNPDMDEDTATAKIRDLDTTEVQKITARLVRLMEGATTKNPPRRPKAPKRNSRR